MRSTISDIYKSGFLYLGLWLLTGLLGSIQMSNSPRFDKWFDQYIKEEVIKKGYKPNVFDALAYSPPLFVFIQLIAVTFGYIVFGMFHLILEKNLSKALKLFIVIFPVSLGVFTGYIAIMDLIENIKWGFYILAFQNVVWFVYLVFIGRKYWKLVFQDKS